MVRPPRLRILYQWHHRVFPHRISSTVQGWLGSHPGLTRALGRLSPCLNHLHVALFERFCLLSLHRCSTFCLRHGGSCQYQPDSNSNSTNTPARQKAVSTSEGPHDPTVVGSLGPIHIHDVSIDPFLGTQYEMPYKSRSLFYLCKRHLLDVHL